MKYGTIWARVGGGIIDFLIVAIISAVVLFGWGFLIGINGSERNLSPAASDALWQGRGFLVGLLLDMVYTITTQASEKQATYGQSAVGLKLVNNDGTKASTAKIIARYFLSLISTIVLKIGYLIAIFTRKNQTLHDLISETVVIEQEDGLNAYVNNKETRSYSYEQPSQTSINHFFQGNESVDKSSKEELKSINFELHTADFKKIYQVNDYDLAKAKNEMKGLIPQTKLDVELMEKFRATSRNKLDAEKKYIYTRAYEISKSSERDEPHQVQTSLSDTLEIWKKNGLIAKQEQENFGTKEPIQISQNSLSNWDSIVAAVLIVIAAVIAYNLYNNSRTQPQPATAKDESPKLVVEKDAPNFFNTDMTYEVKDCYPEINNAGDYQFTKLKTSIDDRTAILFTDSDKTFFEPCFLDGRSFQCTNKISEKTIGKIFFDVIDMNLGYEVIDLDNAVLQQRVQCKIQPISK